MANFTPAKNAFSRVFIIKRRARGDRQPEFQSCLAAGTVERSFGDIESIECPDPTEYGAFEEVGTIRGADERATTSLTGRYASDVVSELLELARIKCEADIHVHFGSCEDPSNFNDFSKAVVLENAFLTSVSVDELGTIESGGQAAVNESADISAKGWYEVLNMTFSERAGSIVTNEVVDIVICDKISCGDCEDESDGCDKIFAITLQAGGSPSTPADVVYSIDNGDTWYAHDIDTLSAVQDPTAIGCLGDYVVVTSNDAGSLSYALKSEFGVTGDPTFTEITTGFVGAPNDIWSIGRKAFIVGDSGYVYSTEDATAGVTVLDAGAATSYNLNAVHAASDQIAVAVGNGGSIVYTLNGTTWSAVSNPPVPSGAGIHFNCVWAKSAKEWWMGTNDGRLFYTVDQGVSFSEKTFTGSGTGEVHDIAFSTDSIAYLSHATTTPAGRILRSYNGGYSWIVLPEGTSSLPANDKVNALAACAADANFVAAGGLADDAADGYIVTGQD
jgi:hypothetical protein